MWFSGCHKSPPPGQTPWPRSAATLRKGSGKGGALFDPSAPANPAPAACPRGLRGGGGRVRARGTSPRNCPPRASPRHWPSGPIFFGGCAAREPASAKLLEPRVLRKAPGTYQRDKPVEATKDHGRARLSPARFKLNPREIAGEPPGLSLGPWLCPGGAPVPGDAEKGPNTAKTNTIQR